MADVQTENGYTRIANQILEEIPQFKFNGTELRIIMAIWRYTYGFQRKEHEISINFLSDATGVDGSRVKKVLKELIKTNVILVVKEATFNSSRVLSFNKNFKEWEVEKDTRGQKQPQASKKTRTQGSKSAPTQGSNFTPKKESIKESNKESSKLKFETPHYKLAELLYKKMKENNPKAKEPNLESWANTIRLMVERDERDGKEIQNIILWSQSHHFWYKNILSADKLRKQFDRLYLEMKDDKRENNYPPSREEEYTLEDQLNEVKGYLELGREYFARKNKESEYDAMLKERERLEQLRDSQGQSTAI